MENLFRFAQIRVPHSAPHLVDALELTSGTRYQRSLAAAAGDVNQRLRQKKAAASFASTAKFVSGHANHRFLENMEKIRGIIEVAASAQPFSKVTLATSIDTALGSSVSAAVASRPMVSDLEDVKDSIITIKLLPDLHRLPINRLAEAIRTYEFLRRMVADPAYPADEMAIRAAMRRTFALPAWLAVSMRKSPSRQPGSGIEANIKTIADRYEAIDHALNELRAIQPSGLKASRQKGIAAKLPLRTLRPEALFQAEMAIRQKVLTATLLSAGSTIANPQGGLANIAGAVPSIMAARSATDLESIMPSTPGLAISRGARIALGGHPEFRPITEQIAMRLDSPTVKGLSSQTKTLLKNLNLDLGNTLPSIVAALLAERRNSHEQAQNLLRPMLSSRSYRVVGNAMVVGASRYAGQVRTASPSRLKELLTDILPSPTLLSIPASHSDISPVGIMDLLLVSQSLKGYELSEISNIENVLQSEYRDKTHRRRFESELITFRESENETESENSTDTSDRFETRRESQNALKEQTNVKGSLTVSGRYGPSVQFQASGEGSWSRNAEMSASAASEVAREVTTRATERITDRLLTQESRRTTLEIEDNEQHRFDNSAGLGNIVGTYQFVSKLYEAQVFNYGQRTLYDMMLPEPGALVLEAFRRDRAAAVELVEPPEFTLRPEELTADSYQDSVSLYGASGVKPPPEPFTTETYDFNTGGEDVDQEFTNSTRIRIQDGYQAVQASVGIAVMVWDDWVVDSIIGRRSHRFSTSNDVWITNLNSETGSIPFAITTDRVGDIAVAVEVTCAATDRAIALWQAETYGLLVDAYRARRSEYETRLADLQSAAPMEIISRSSDRNRDMMVDELKRACISMLTEQHFDLFDAVNKGALNLPQIDFQEARSEGAYARFFEQAFEWENIAWVPYSYFWGRKKGWLEKLVLTDGDTEFERFLKAGFARVVVPVRPGFEPAVDHFRLFGDPWLGGQLPTVSDATYLPVADEIAERLDRPGDEVPQGPTWEVRVPTALIALRQSPGLPTWAKQNDGSWQPSN